MLKYNGKNLEDFNIKIEHNLEVTSPEVDMDFYEIKGLDGDIAISNDRLKGFERSFPFVMKSSSVEKDFNDLMTFLRKDVGWHDLTFAGSDGYTYKAMVVEQMNLNRVVKRFGRGVLTFRMKPVKYVTSSLNKLPLGTSINNPTTRSSKPQVIIEGSGNITITIGKSKLTLKNVDKGVIIDSSSQTITNLSGTQAQFDKMTSYPFPEIAPGNNTVTKTGTITGIQIVPRWEVVAT